MHRSEMIGLFTLVGAEITMRYVPGMQMNTSEAIVFSAASLGLVILGVSNRIISAISAPRAEVKFQLPRTKAS
jgi:hypothetical protein